MTAETDEDGLGGFTSHFELYLDAMGQAGADTSAIDDFIARIRRREDVGHALDCCAAPPDACRFVNTTLNVPRSGELHRIAACFTFGREDIIPEMFRNMAEEIRKSNSARIELSRPAHRVDTDNHRSDGARDGCGHMWRQRHQMARGRGDCGLRDEVPAAVLGFGGGDDPPRPV